MTASLHDRITETVRLAILTNASPEVMAMQVVAALADAGPIDRAWVELCAATAELGRALAVFENARTAYGKAKRGET